MIEIEIVIEIAIILEIAIELEIRIVLAFALVLLILFLLFVGSCFYLPPVLLEKELEERVLKGFDGSVQLF